VKEYIAHYYHFSDKLEESRSVVIKANTAQDAVLQFNVKYGGSSTLVYIEPAIAE
jgi:hypothetical protein